MHDSKHDSSKPSSVLAGEVAHFSALARDWWNPRGPMAPLHAMNPLRTAWIKDNLPLSLQKEQESRCLNLLDIGCGAGLASEAFAKLGFETLGIDASAEAIEAAREHLHRMPLPPRAARLAYHHGTAEECLAEGKQFDIVSALEVIEHVRDPQEFIQLLARLVRPGGVVALSTLNRTMRSFLMAKLGAEYVLRLLPVGTHDWKKFIRPVELDGMARMAELELLALRGMVYSRPFWKESHDTSVNYIALFRKEKESEI